MPAPNITDQGDLLIVTLDDQTALNDSQADSYRKALYELVQERPNPKLLVDLNAIEFLSSSGIALLIGLKRRVDAANGQLALARVQPYVLDVFKVMKILTLFTITDTVESGLARLRSTSPA